MQDLDFDSSLVCLHFLLYGFLITLESMEIIPVSIWFSLGKQIKWRNMNLHLESWRIARTATRNEIQLYSFLI